MSIDKLHNRIRKLKNPSIIDLTIDPQSMPQHLFDEETDAVTAYGRFCNELLDALKEIVPAVRVSLTRFVLLGSKGWIMLADVLATAKKYGYYVLLDVPGALTKNEAQIASDMLFEGGDLYFDGLITSAYIGSDGLQPYLKQLKNNDKDLFTVLRTPNKTAPEIQDLLTGSRLVHVAAADIVYRIGEPFIMRSGFSCVGAVTAATSVDSIRNLRQRYKYMFLLVDGYDYPGANAKICSNAFDRLGHGAAVSSGAGITAAWKEYTTDSREYVSYAVKAAERMKKNLTNYITVL